MSPRDSIKQAAPSNRAQWIAVVVTIITAFGGGAGIRAVFVPGITTDQARELGEKLDTTSKELGRLRDQLTEQNKESKKIREANLIDARKQDQHIDLIAKSLARMNSGSPAFGWPRVDADNWTVSPDLATHRTREAWAE